MRLVVWLLKKSWRIVVLAGVVGAVSGAASMALVILIMQAIGTPGTAPPAIAGLFAGLCLVVLATRIGSQLLLCRFTQNSMSQLRLGLCRRILDAPLQHLEEIGTHRLLAALTSDVGTVTQAVQAIPALVVNLVILLCGTTYLGWLSPGLMLSAVAFAVLGVASYWYTSRWARVYVRRAREAHDGLLKQIRELIDGVKELKMHRPRRGLFFEQVVRSEAAVRQGHFIGTGLFDAAIIWGRLTFFIAIGLLLFAWPRFSPVDATTLTGYVLTILYLISPLEQLVAWLPMLSWAQVSVTKIEQLGLMLDQTEEEPVGRVPPSGWERIELAGVTHAYRPDGRTSGFVLGPLDVTIQPGECLFIVGGNGSGKTTLAKLLTGLYAPDSGAVRLNGLPITAETRDSYRQLFSVVFDEGVVFDSLWGLEAADLDQRAREYLRQLELEQVVSVTDGAFSTIKLSRGQRKRLALLTARLEDRPIYVFDEWAADQDPQFRKMFYLRLLPELKRRGKTVVAITHDDRYFANADRVIKLEEGKVVEAFRHELPAVASVA